MVLTRVLVLAALLAAAAVAPPAPARCVWVPGSGGELPIDRSESDAEEEEVRAIFFFSGEKDVQLNLYTQTNPTTPELIFVSDDSSSPSFNPKNPTRFVIHGLRSSGENMDVIRHAYIDAGLDFNVVIVDWSSPAANLYWIAKINSRRVGDYLAEVLRHLVSARGLRLDDVHIVGHSLGCHAAGVAGHRLGGRVAQIVGLDCAAPFFSIASLENRLDSSDAKFVQAIHTNGGVLGWEEPLGDADFFPNGGSSQPGCILNIISALFQPLCSHSRAWQFYAESIGSKNFIARACDSYSAYKNGSCSKNDHAPMGEWAPLTSRGSYYLMTNSESLFAKGDVGL